MLLAIDTATRVLSLALYDGQQVCAELTWLTANQHTVELMPAIRDLLERAHLAITDLSALAVSQGPGSFNGLRIGFSAAKGLAMARNLPLISVPTLDIIAAAQPGFSGRLIAVVQAGRGRVVAGSYDWHEDGWIGKDDVQIVAWQALLENSVDIVGSIGINTMISGEIDVEGHLAIEAAARAGKPIRAASPAFGLRRAGFLAEIAWRLWRAGHSGDAAGAVPLYLHPAGVPHP